MNIQSVTFNDFTFVESHDPKELEIKDLMHTYGFKPIYLDDFITRQLVPKIEVTENYKLVVLDFPYIDDEEKKAEKEKEQKELKTEQTEQKNISPEVKQEKDLLDHVKQIPEIKINNPVPLPQISLSETKKVRVRTGFVSFFLGPNYLVVLHDDKTPIVDKIFEECQKTLRKREELLGNGAEYLFYHIVDQLVDSSTDVVNEISKKIDRIDKVIISQNVPRNIFEDLSVTRRNIVIMKSMVKPAHSIFSDLQAGKTEGFSPDMKEYWGSITDHLQKMRYRLEGARELVEGISVSYESLLTAKTNEIIKVLTMFTAILLPLTLVASMYGMNIVNLPFAKNFNSFTIISLFMILLALLMILAFKIRRWL